MHNTLNPLCDRSTEGIRRKSLAKFEIFCVFQLWFFLLNVFAPLPKQELFNFFLLIVIFHIINFTFAEFYFWHRTSTASSSFWCVNSHVCVKMSSLTELFTTNRTTIRFLSSVTSLVYRKADLLAESLITNRTFIWFLSTVTSQVCLKICLLVESLVT